MNPTIGRWYSKERDKHLFRNQENKVWFLATSFLKGCAWALPALCTPGTTEYLGACAIRYKGLDTSKGSRWGEWGDQSSFSRVQGGPTNCRHLFIASGESGSTLKKKKENYFSMKTNWYVSGIASLFHVVQDSSLAPVKWNAPEYIWKMIRFTKVPFVYNLSHSLALIKKSYTGMSPCDMDTRVKHEARQMNLCRPWG